MYKQLKQSLAKKIARLYFFENNLRNKQETKKLTTAPIKAITTVKTTSCRLILKIVERKVPPTIPERNCKSFCCICCVF